MRNWYSAKRAGVQRACLNKVMAHMWFMHDTHLGHEFLFLEILAEYTLLSMTVMVTPCLKYVVGMKLVMYYAKFPQAPFARALLGECRRKNGVRNRCPYRRCGVDTEIPYRLFSLMLCRGRSVEAEFSRWFWSHPGSRY